MTTPAPARAEDGLQTLRRVPFSPPFVHFGDGTDAAPSHEQLRPPEVCRPFRRRVEAVDARGPEGWTKGSFARISPGLAPGQSRAVDASRGFLTHSCRVPGLPRGQTEPPLLVCPQLCRRLGTWGHVAGQVLPSPHRAHSWDIRGRRKGAASDLWPYALAVGDSGWHVLRSPAWWPQGHRCA